jgi:hypothetical protein
MLSFNALLAQHGEDRVLNGIWIGLLSVEALMVLGVALRGLVGAVSSSSTTWKRRRSSAAAGAMTPMSVHSQTGVGIDEFWATM